MATIWQVKAIRRERKGGRDREIAGEGRKRKRKKRRDRRGEREDKKRERKRIHSLLPLIMNPY